MKLVRPDHERRIGEPVLLLQGVAGDFGVAAVPATRFDIIRTTRHDFVPEATALAREHFAERKPLAGWCLPQRVDMDMVVPLSLEAEQRSRAILRRHLVEPRTDESLIDFAHQQLQVLTRTVQPDAPVPHQRDCVREAEIVEPVHHRRFPAALTDRVRVGGQVRCHEHLIPPLLPPPRYSRASCSAHRRLRVTLGVVRLAKLVLIPLRGVRLLTLRIGELLVRLGAFLCSLLGLLGGGRLDNLAVSHARI